MTLNLVLCKSDCLDCLLVRCLHLIKSDLDFFRKNAISKLLLKRFLSVLDHISKTETVGTENTTVLVNVNC